MIDKFNINRVRRVLSDKLMNKFDTFICHNKKDVDEAKWLNEALKNNGISTWFDEEQIKPGTWWQREIEKDIPKIKSVLACVGASGIGPWHDIEMQTFLQNMVQNHVPVIPVIMRNVPSHLNPDFPIFMRNIHFVDIRKEEDSIKKIVWVSSTPFVRHYV